MGIPYDTGFPVSNDSLGSTRDKFFNNIASIKTFVDVNHYDFNDALYGNHKWTTYGRLTSTFPDLTGTLATAIAAYGASDGTRTQLWIQPSGDATGTQAIQLSAGDVTNARFSTNTTYEANHAGGWTFLPGKLYLQYGTINNATIPATGTVNFPVAFSAAPYSLTFGISRVSGSASSQNIYYDTLTATSFGFSNTSSSNGPISWIAIGPA